ncbi:MAG: cytochrome P450 [Granulosicoccus sp.]|nr:cytochrome P450 [Granulosicoccus sp.]
MNDLLRDRRFARVLPASDAGRSPPNQAHLSDFSRTEAHSLLNLEPPEHTRLRSRVNHAFIAREIRALSPDIQDFARNCLNELFPRGTADLLPHYATPIPATIIARMIGVPDSRIDDLLAWSHAMVKVYTLTQTLEEEIIANDAASAFTCYLVDLIAEKRRAPAADLLSHLLLPCSETGSVLTDDELISITILLLNAGHEATVHQTGNAIKTLLESDYKPLELFATPELSAATVTELLRFDAPLHLFTRYALEDVSIDDVQLRAGEQIGLCLGAANRDPEHFADADLFNPYRKDGGQVSLGAGIHFCVGAQLAKLELETAIPLVFSMLPNLSLAAPAAYRASFHFHGLEQLKVQWQISSE